MNTPEKELEDLWGYAKRLRFVRRAIAEAFPSRAAHTLSVLDVGCGNGSQLAVPLTRTGFQVTGVDTDARSIEHARRLVVEMPNARFLCVQVGDLPTAQTFEIVILSEVLEHTLDPAALLAESARRLKLGGVLIVTVPNGYGEFEIDSWLYRTLRLQRLIDAVASRRSEVVASTDNQADGHVQFFTRRRLLRLFADCGLTVISQSASSIFSGPLAGHTLARIPGFIEWNARTADALPLELSSGWFFALRRVGEGKESERGV